MDYETIRQNIENKVYDSKVEYSKFPRKNNPKEWSDAIRAYSLSDMEGTKQFKKDCRAYIETVIGKPITDKQYNTIFDKAWEDGHASGYSDILSCLDDLLDVVRVFVNK